MAKVARDQPLVPSVLDRLLDDEPTARRETPRSRTQVLRELRQSVRRDLENLLNTRSRAISWPEDLEDLDLSLVNYGIPDVTGMSFQGQRSREELRRVIQRVIEHFEPRLRSVEVEMLDPAEPVDRRLRFRIRAMLEVEPAPEPLTFDSEIYPSTGSVTVTGTSR